MSCFEIHFKHLPDQLSRIFSDTFRRTILKIGSIVLQIFLKGAMLAIFQDQV